MYLILSLSILLIGCIGVTNTQDEQNDQPQSELNLSSVDEISSSAEEVLSSAEVRGFRFLALGDSYTIGQGVDPSQRWPQQLVDSLGYSVDSLRVYAKTGWTTRDLLNGTVQFEVNSFDLVSLQIGVNNQFRGWDIEVFQNEFDTLLAQSISFAGGNENVIVLSIPDYGFTPFGESRQEIISAELDGYNAYIKQQCESNSIRYYNITDISRSELGTIAPDQLHPDGPQYTQWLNEFLKDIRTQFDSKFLTN